MAPVVVEVAPPTLLQQMKTLVWQLKRKPSTRENLSDRILLFEKYFHSLTASDRIALFGTSDFRHLEAAVRSRGDKSPQALDRCLAQMRLVLF
jgi:hypothetical protein